MPTLPAELLPLIVNFQPLFAKSVWNNAQTLLVGAILAIRRRYAADESWQVLQEVGERLILNTHLQTAVNLSFPFSWSHACEDNASNRRSSRQAQTDCRVKFRLIHSP
jgi:hypothetical protein